MPAAAKDLAMFYHQLGIMLQAGVSIQNALRSLTKSSPCALRRAVTTLMNSADRGISLHDALTQQSGVFPALDRQALAICEQSGALDTGLLALGEYHEARARARSQIIGASTLPGCILVAAVFISRLPALILGMFGEGAYSLTAYLRDTAGLLVTLAIGGYVLGFTTRFLPRVPGLSLPLDRVFNAIPIVGRIRFDYALSQWIAGIRLLLNAGMGVIAALDRCSRLARSPVIARAWEQARPLLDRQVDVSEALRSTGVFPDMVIEHWATGEQSGKMDEMLARLADYYQDRWRRNLALLATWLPRLAYAAVSVYIIVQIAILLGPAIGAYRDGLR